VCTIYCLGPGYHKLVHYLLSRSRVSDGSKSSTDSCGEEDFYYTEIEVNVDNVTQGFSNMYSVPPSPTTTNNSIEPTQFVIPDHDYQKKVSISYVNKSIFKRSIYLLFPISITLNSKTMDFILYILDALAIRYKCVSMYML